MGNHKPNGLWSKAASRGWSAWCVGTATGKVHGGQGRMGTATQHHRCRLPTCPCRCHRKRLGKVRLLDDGTLLITCYECRKASRYRGLSRHGAVRSQQLAERGWVNATWQPGLRPSSGGPHVRWRHVGCDAKAYASAVDD